MSALTSLFAVAGVGTVLVDLFVVLLAAKLGEALFRRLKQPGLIGAVLAGVVVGPSVLGTVQPGEPLEIFAELGAVFLLFWIGLETHISDLGDVGKPALLAGVVGAVLPFVGGVSLGFSIDEGAATSIFLGSALVATSIGITSAVLVQLKVVKSRASRTILGAAVVDDIVAMVLLAVASGIVVEGKVDAGGIVVAVVLAVAFVGFFAFGGTKLMRDRPRLLQVPRFAESPLLPAVILCLGLAAFAAEIGLAAIIGAFLAGMIFAETPDNVPIESEIAPLYAFFPPFFFAFIGIQLNIETFIDGETLLLLLVVTVVAVLTKFVGAWLGARSLGKQDALFVGVGMIPRGEVGVIVAGIGQATGVIDQQLFAVIVGMSVLTTLLAPPLLRSLYLSRSG